MEQKEMPMTSAAEVGPDVKEEKSESGSEERESHGESTDQEEESTRHREMEAAEDIRGVVEADRKLFLDKPGKMARVFAATMGLLAGRAGALAAEHTNPAQIQPRVENIRQSGEERYQKRLEAIKERVTLGQDPREYVEGLLRGQGADFSQEIFDKITDSVVTVLRKTNGGIGTGFFVGDSIIVTNRHVAETAQAEQLTVVNVRGEEVVIERVYLIEDDDIAVIETKEPNANHLRVASQDAAPGDDVWHLGMGRSFEQEVMNQNPDVFYLTGSKGEVSQSSGESVEYDLYVDPGDSGGPILDRDGNIVAINYLGTLERSAKGRVGKMIREGTGESRGDIMAAVRGTVGEDLEIGPRGEHKEELPISLDDVVDSYKSEGIDMAVLNDEIEITRLPHIVNKLQDFLSRYAKMKSEGTIALKTIYVGNVSGMPGGGLERENNQERNMPDILFLDASESVEEWVKWCE